MDNEEDSRWKISVRELQRQIEAQKSEYEFYQRQATLFLRISLATLGVIVGSISILGGNTISGMIEFITNFRIHHTASRINLSPTITELVVGVLYITFLSSSVASIFRIVSIPRYTFRIAYPKRLIPGLNTYQARRIASDQSVDYEDYTLLKLRETIITNEKTVNYVKEQFERSLRGATDGIRYGVIAVATFLVLVSGETTLISVFAISASILGILIIGDKFNYNRHRKFLKIYWEVSVTLFIIILWVVSPATIIVPATDLFVVLAIFSLIIPFWGILYSSRERIEYIVAQLLGLISILLTILYLHVSIRPQLTFGRFSFAVMIVIMTSIVLLLEIVIVYNTISLIEYADNMSIRKELQSALKE